MVTKSPLDPTEQIAVESQPQYQFFSFKKIIINAVCLMSVFFSGLNVLIGRYYAIPDGDL